MKGEGCSAGLAHARLRLPPMGDNEYGVARDIRTRAFIRIIHMPGAATVEVSVVRLQAVGIAVGC